MPTLTMPSSKIIAFATLWIGLLAPATSEAAHPLIEDTHTISVGGFDQTMAAKITAQRGAFEPIALELEDLTIDDEDISGMFEYRYRLGERWVLSTSAYRWVNSGGGEVRDTFNFVGQEFDVGIGIATRLSVDTYIFDALYSVYRDEQTEIALGGGVHALDAEASILAIADVDGTLISGESASRADILAPLPNVRGSFIHALNDRFAISGIAGWLSANIDEYSGGFTYAHLTGQYQLSDSIGLSLGYTFVELDVEESLDNGMNEFKFLFDGVTVGFSYSF